MRPYFPIIVAMLVVLSLRWIVAMETTPGGTRLERIVVAASAQLALIGAMYLLRAWWRSP